jgi:pimeloyl-ACP methyl ester carboxylesterase
VAETIPIFRSLSAEIEFTNAYDAVMKDWPVPYEDLYVPTRFGKTHVIASGLQEAPPLVLLPPGGGYAPIWIRNAGALSKYYRTYVVDIIGEVNKSVPTRPIRNHPEFMEWITDLFDGLHVERVDLVGNSNGGFFTLETALYLPERLKKVVLISPAATFEQMWAWWRHLLIPAHIIAPLLHAEGMIMKAYDWLWQGFQMDEYYAKLRTVSKLAGRGYRPSINSAIPRVLTDNELKAIKVPALLLIGDHEVIYNTSRVIRRATELVKGLRAEIVPNANHSAQYTAPDFVNAKILEFLQS